jgi:hypothetical protein
MKSKLAAAIDAAVRVAEVRGILKAVAHLKLTITYVPLAKMLGLFAGGSELAGLLGEIQEECYQSGAPILTSLVIKVNLGVPGPGYFSHLRSLGAEIGLSPKEEFEFWLGQMELLGVPLTKEALEWALSFGIVVPAHLGGSPPPVTPSVAVNA